MTTSAPEQERPVNLITLSRDMYPEGSFGHQLFPGIIEGRQRPDDYADFNLHVTPSNRATVAALGIVTLADVLPMRVEEVMGHIPPRRQLYLFNEVDRLANAVADKLRLTPHARLLRTISGDSQGTPTPIEEPRIITRVEEAVSELPVRYAEMVQFRYGLNDWQFKTLYQTGQEFGVVGAQVNQILSKAAALLRHPDSGQSLDDVSMFADDSVARAMGIRFRGDITLARGQVLHGLSDETVEFLSGIVRNIGANYPVDYEVVEGRKAVRAKSLLEVCLPDDNPMKSEVAVKLAKLLELKRHIGDFGDLLITAGRVGELALDDPKHFVIGLGGVRSDIREMNRIGLPGRDDDGHETMVVHRVDRRKNRELTGYIAGKMSSYLEDILAGLA